MMAGLAFVPGRAVPPVPQRDWALFLDLDGTLLDIAATPYAVVVPRDLVADLKAAAAALDGALAIISGRALRDIDNLLAPLRLPAAGEHGAIVRLPGGTQDEVEAQVPNDWIETLLRLQETCPGVFTEWKTHNVVAHFRNAAAHETTVRRVAAELVSRDRVNFELLEAKMAVEIRPRAVTKARAVSRLMEVEPFAGRVPVFVGDDRTDHDGFAAAIALGGIALDVAHAFAGRPGEVRAWLKRVAEIEAS
jgi:trehalose 6-phosphate phosphatase